MHVLHVHDVKLRHSVAHSGMRRRKAHQLTRLLLMRRHLLVLRRSELLLQQKIMMRGTRLRLKKNVFVYSGRMESFKVTKYFFLYFNPSCFCQI
jgi:hypothetical protein